MGSKSEDFIRAAIGVRYAALGPFALAAVIGGCGALSLAHFRALPEIRARVAAGSPNPSGGDGWPLVSIVVPARNEEANLPRLLRSLIALDYPSIEVIVVDDASTDATGAVAERYAADTEGLIRVIHTDGPKPGWTGKTWACWQGAQVAHGTWLLFADADTEQRSGSLRAALQVAREAGASALSLFARQECITFWERLLLSFAYQQYFVGVRPRRLRATKGPALANGQYLLVARQAYEAAGGHAAVAASIIDDVALARALKRMGYPVLACRGDSLVRVRMYTGLAALAEGFRKNSFPFLRAQGVAGALVVLSTACNAAVPAAVVISALIRSPVALAGALLAYAVQVAALAPWERAFGVRMRYAWLAPLAATVFMLIALSSALRVIAGRSVRWKGRRYSARGMVAPERVPAKAKGARRARSR
jgi:chlorobactene glucosyltransferase